MSCDRCCVDDSGICRNYKLLAAAFYDRMKKIDCVQKRSFCLLILLSQNVIVLRGPACLGCLAHVGELPLCGVAADGGVGSCVLEKLCCNKREEIVSFLCGNLETLVSHRAYVRIRPNTNDRDS